MKNLMCFLLLFACVIQINAQTNITSNIETNTIWTQSGSPYLIDYYITISKTATLTIEPGVIIKARSGTIDMLDVEGTLLAQGTESEPIIFTSIMDDLYGGDSNNDGNTTTPKTDEWGSIHVGEASGNSSRFSHCVFRFGGKVNGVLFADKSSPEVTDCRFEACKYGWEANGFLTPVLSNSHFEAISNLPVIISLGSQPLFSGNTVNNNTLNAIGIKQHNPLIAGDQVRLKKISFAGIENIPYVPDYTVTISKSATLTIEPGVIIKARSGTIDMFDVEGTLLAQGTESEPIIFTSIMDDLYGGDSNNDGNTTTPKTDEWGSIHVGEGSGNSSRFSHCVFRFGGKVNGVLFADKSLPEVTDCRFEACKYGWEANGFLTPVLNNSHFEAISNLPVIISLGSQPVFSGNTVNNNTLNAIGIKQHNPLIAGDQVRLKKISFAGIENIPYVPDYTVTISKSATLTIEPGVIIKALSGTIDMFDVEGTLLAQGTESEPIIFTSILDDLYGGDLNNDGNTTTPKTDEWGSIHVGETSGNSSRFSHCVFRFGGKVNGALYIQNSTPGIQHVIFESCETGMNVASLTGLNSKDLYFSKSKTGLLIQTENSPVVIDSSIFEQNREAVFISKGTALINHSEFTDNELFDIKNQSTSDINATYNWWKKSTTMEIVKGPNPKNLKKLYDHFDDENYGTIDYSNFLISQKEVFIVAPEYSVYIHDTATVLITAYPVTPETRVILRNQTTGDWLPESTTYLDPLNVKIFLDFSAGHKGMYDIVLINGQDSIIKKEGFALVESQTPFGEWVKFKVSKDTLYSAGVLLPQSPQIFCFLKKFAGYSGTGTGSIKINTANGPVTYDQNLNSDIFIRLENVAGGYYTFYISTDTREFWDGYIKFCLNPDTLILNEWNTGKTLRPCGSDWKVFEIKNDLDSLTFQSEGYGMWSSINVYYEFPENNKNQWYFAGKSGKGYRISGVIPNAKKGLYYVKYTDSGILLDNGGSYSSDQSKDYIIFAGTKEAPFPDKEISLTSVSSYNFGKGYSTLILTGKGLSAETFVRLYNEQDTLIPVKVFYNEELSNLVVDFDFSLADTGKYTLNLKNRISDYVHSEKIIIENNQWKPIGIQIIGNDKYRIGRHQTVIVKVTNNSNRNIENGYITVEFDNKNLSMSIEDDLYIQGLNAKVDSCYKELHILKENFFFSNLPPHEDIYIKLKMFSDNPNMGPATLRVTSGKIQKSTYNYLFSLFTDITKGILLEVPLEQTIKDKINGFSENEWNEITDMTADFLGLNRFDYTMGQLNIKSSSAHLKSGGYSYGSGTRKARTATDWMSAGANAASGGFEGMVNNGGIGLLPGGIGMASDPFNMINAGLGQAFDKADIINDALNGINPDDPSERPSRALAPFKDINSTTPEDKYGPIGASVEINDSVSYHFIDTSAVFDYRIDYWNKEDATAPAANVYIRDTLDTDFDLSSFNFTEVGFLKWKAQLEGGSYFNVNIDCRPEMPYFVNIEGTLDPASREVYWVHTTLDPATMEPTEDPEGGYLPPIDSSGYQIGWVYYTIKSKDNLPDATEFTNQAFVNFDGVGKWGPAPKEGPFTNVFDMSKPNSIVNQNVTRSSIDSVLINWSGTDIGSGIKDFTIYVSEGSGFIEWKSYISDTTDWFHGEMGKTYYFYSIARDRVGNIESKDIKPELTLSFSLTKISNPINNGNGFKLFPNPTSGIFTLENDFTSDVHAQVEIFNLLGEKIYSCRMLENKMLLDLSKQTKGVYIIFVNHNNISFNKKLIIK